MYYRFGLRRRSLSCATLSLVVAHCAGWNQFASALDQPVERRNMGRMAHALHGAPADRRLLLEPDIGEPGAVWSSRGVG